MDLGGPFATALVLVLIADQYPGEDHFFLFPPTELARALTLVIETGAEMAPIIV